MKINVNPDGAVSFDVNENDDNAKILGIISWLQWDLARRAQERLPHQPPHKRPAVKPVGTLDFATRPGGVFTGTQTLNSLQYATWSFLVDHDCPAGIHLSAVARHFEVTDNAAGQRLCGLVDLGYAQRVSVGHYRAVDGKKSPATGVQVEPTKESVKASE